jgi:ABC-2 type transport system ATP-binding protein
VGSGALHVRLLDPEQRPEAERVLAGQLGSVHLESDPASLSVGCADPDRGAEAVAELTRGGIRIGSFSLGQPSLDEVFLALTGHPAEDQAAYPDGSVKEGQAA